MLPKFGENYSREVNNSDLSHFHGVGTSTATRIAENSSGKFEDAEDCVEYLDSIAEECGYKETDMKLNFQAAVAQHASNKWTKLHQRAFADHAYALWNDRNDDDEDSAESEDEGNDYKNNSFDCHELAEQMNKIHCTEHSDDERAEEEN